MKALYFLLILNFVWDTQCSWLRSNLLYHDEHRSDLSAFKRHLMRVTPNGEFIGQWLFDSSIITAHTINDKSVVYAKDLQGIDMTKLLDRFYATADKLDQAAAELYRDYPTLQGKIKLSIGVPYFSKDNKNFRDSWGRTLDFSKREDRLNGGKWYLNELKWRADARQSRWRFLEMWGAYYIREDVVDSFDDPYFVKGLNQETHRIGLKSVWIPYHDAPNSWTGKSDLGFDVVNMQPSYGYTGPIDGADVRPNRLYQIGERLARQGECFEYEFRPDLWIAHQYLAIAQFTGADKYPQAFFVGPIESDDVKAYPDLFDRIGSETVEPLIWNAYTDIANYLGNQTINNVEIGLAWPEDTSDPNLRVTSWQLTGNGEDYLSTVRLDFRDNNLDNPWRGQVRVIVNWDRTRASYSYRAGNDDIYPEYNSVHVPFPIIFQGQRINHVRVELTREPGTEWPLLHRLIASKQEPIFVANPLYESVSTSSRPQPIDDNSDRADTHKNFYRGKLTDGQKSSNGEWWTNPYNVGWKMITGRFTIYLDLEIPSQLSHIRIHTYKDENAAVVWPNHVGVLIGSNCPPQMTGTPYDGLSCVPEASGGNAKLMTNWHPGSPGYFSGIFETKLNGIRGRYVTISALCPYICLIDEIEVFDTRNMLISRGRPYRISPGPVNNIARSVVGEPDGAYGDDGRSLVNGFVMRDWVFGPAADGLNGENQFVEATWNTPKTPKYAIIWLTEASPGFDIKFPNSINIQVRNEQYQWEEPGDTVRPSLTACVIAPCAGVALPQGKRITGVKGSIPKTDGWHMITEISIH